MGEIDHIRSETACRTHIDFQSYEISYITKSLFCLGKSEKLKNSIILLTLLCIVVLAGYLLSNSNSKTDRDVSPNDNYDADIIVDTDVLGSNEKDLSSSDVTDAIAADVDATDSKADDLNTTDINAAESNVEDLNSTDSNFVDSESAVSDTVDSVTASSVSEGLDISESNLNALKEEYPETVAWLYFEDGHISYPIMQGSDNKKYKHLGYTQEEAWEGSIFLDYRSAADFTDANTIVYGHNMKDRTMFGTLRDYRELPEYFNEHQYFWIITPDNKYKYQVFQYMDVAENYVIYDYVGDASKELVEDIEPVRRKTYLDYDITIDEKDKIVTLSTCTDKDSLQFVVLGVLVEEMP